MKTILLVAIGVVAGAVAYVLITERGEVELWEDVHDPV